MVSCSLRGIEVGLTLFRWAELRAGYEDCWRLYTSIAQDQEELKRRFGKGKGHARVAECQFFMVIS